MAQQANDNTFQRVDFLLIQRINKEKEEFQSVFPKIMRFSTYSQMASHASQSHADVIQRWQ